MGLANFFDKAALGASQILQKFDYTGFQNILSSHAIEIRTTYTVATTGEGRMILDLLTRLFARLYPNLKFTIENDSNEYTNQLASLAKSINPGITISTELTSTIIVNVGDIKNSKPECPQFFLGSNRWLGYFSSTKAQSCTNSSNPFGAGFAACIGAANVFRVVFKEYLPLSEPDTEIVFSCFDYSINEKAAQGPEIDEVRLDHTVVVGLGAIGNAVVWCLSHLQLFGNLDLVDDEEIEISNLQRYILTDQLSIGKTKVELARQFINQPELDLTPYAKNWKQYLKTKNDWNIHRAVIGVDSAQARIDIQASLPLKIINGWTQMEQIGVSRHFDFVNDACLVCLYFPDKVKKSLSEEIAENLNMLHLERDIIRKYIADRQPVDQNLLAIISQQNNIPVEELLPYSGKLLEVFHSEVVCGGVLMKLTGTTNKKSMVHVPSAFESALAGLFVAAELVIDAGNLRPERIPNITKMNLMRPLTKYTKELSEKHWSGRCICQDPVFISAHKKKWSSKV